MGNKRYRHRSRVSKDQRVKKARKVVKKQVETTPESPIAGSGQEEDGSNIEAPPIENSEPTAPEVSIAIPTASERKIKPDCTDVEEQIEEEDPELEEFEDENTSEDDDPNMSGQDLPPLGGPPCYFMMDSNILLPIMKELIKCPRCGYSIDCFIDTAQKQGLVQLMVMFCLNVSCQWEKTVYSSKTIETAKRGLKPFDLNLRAVMTFREMGRGHQAMEAFCGYMNMPPPMGETVYNTIVKEKLHPAYISSMNDNIIAAANEIRELSASQAETDFDDNEVYNTTVSCDGTWQRRGYSSLNGVFTVVSIDTGKCLGIECLIKTCKSCDMWKGRIGTPQYVEFIANHVCTINHEGSAPAMETVGIGNIFSRSVKDLKLRYTTYIGDGDSKAYPAVVKANPYGDDHPVVKGECVGHVQKRVGGRLRKFKKENSSMVLSDKKKLGGKGRLHDKWINKLQNYYGLAIRQNTDSLNNMRKAVAAVLYHCSEANSSASRHMFCPKNAKWCKMRLAEEKGEKYVDKPGLPVAIRDAIKPIFQDLSSETLLSKCLHGKTQNCNESLNGVVWRRLPKDINVGRHTLEVGVASAVLSFNSGTAGLLAVYNKLDINSGYFTDKYCERRDKARIKFMTRKMSAKGKAIRKRKRAQRKGFDVVNEEKEGEQYGAGLF